MLLKICENGFFEKIDHIELFFVFILVLSLVLIIFIKKNHLFRNENIVHEKVSLIFILLILFVFTYFLICYFFNLYYNNTCVLASNGEFYQLPTHEKKVDFYQDIYKNKVIIIGDSRMSLIDDNINDYNIPVNYSFIAKSGTKIDWFVSDAMPLLEKVLDSNKDNIYHVVINMGVNDINNVQNVKDKALEYFSYYKELIEKYPNVNFYFLSINPTIKSLMDVYWAKMNISNDNIELFNDTLAKKIITNKKDSIFYCDSYNNINFKTYDGLHYRKETSQKIINFIVKDCVVLK